MNPVVEPAATEGSLEAPATQFSPEKGGVENVDPECVVLEEVTWPLEEIRNVDVSRSTEEPFAVESDLVQDGRGQHASESEHSVTSSFRNEPHLNELFFQSRKRQKLTSQNRKWSSVNKRGRGKRNGGYAKRELRKEVWLKE